ncbi:hypothetical protein Salat_2207200 [Sesamum alatum]|uniref:Uncharacterized protein n=1 Tax=Sesamum alatum TaxID=300844 RepID=A0AAE1XTS6_9LAMI|nr:hypothetical protein Salat_2207200 [Sesamum alatum]
MAAIDEVQRQISLAFLSTATPSPPPLLPPAPPLLVVPPHKPKTNPQPHKLQPQLSPQLSNPTEAADHLSIPIPTFSNETHPFQHKLHQYHNSNPFFSSPSVQFPNNTTSKINVVFSPIVAAVTPEAAFPLGPPKLQFRCRCVHPIAPASLLEPFFDAPSTTSIVAPPVPEDTMPLLLPRRFLVHTPPLTQLQIYALRPSPVLADELAPRTSPRFYEISQLPLFPHRFSLPETKWFLGTRGFFTPKLPLGVYVALPLFIPLNALDGPNNPIGLSDQVLVPGESQLESATIWESLSAFCCRNLARSNCPAAYFLFPGLEFVEENNELREPLGLFAETLWAKRILPKLQLISWFSGK